MSLNSHPVQDYSRPEAKDTSVVDTTLQVSSFVLQVLQDGAKFAPVPFLQDAAGVALTILNAAQSARANREGFTRLAQDACGLVFAILCKSRDGQGNGTALSPELLNNLKELVDTLYSIQKLAKKEAKRNALVRMFKYQSDAGKILEYRERLRQSLDLFGIQSNISMHDSLALIIKQQEILMQEAKERKERDDELQAQREKEIAEGRGDNVAAEAQPTSQLNERSFRSPNNASATSTPPSSHNFNLNSPTGSFTVTTVAGDKSDTNNTNTTTNTNSGNTTNTNITGSYNDSSYRNYGGPGRAKRRGRGH